MLPATDPVRRTPVAADHARLVARLLVSILLFLCSAGSAHAQDLSATDLAPFSLSGSLVTSAENYSMPGMNTHRPVNTARLFFNPTVTFYGLQLPFSFILSTNERSYNQPFNQFGVSPHYKAVTLHAGYRSLQFSEFTLSDAVILGGGAEVDAEWLHLRGMYGRFRRKVDEDTLLGILPVYSRMGYALSAGFGSEKNKVALNIVHAWDDSTSVRPLTPSAAPAPEENLTLGIAARTDIIAGRFTADGELAGSFLTRDLRQPQVEDPDVTALATGVYDARLSSSFTSALKLGLAWNEKSWSVRTEFARVEPEFTSAGATYTQGDRQDITIAPTLRLAEGSVRVSGSLGFRSDNLLDDRAYTTHRVIGSGTLNWTPSNAFGIDANYSNYSMSNASAALAVNDTSRVENVSASWSLSPRLSFATGTMQHMCMLFVTSQNFVDRNVLTGKNSDNDMLTGVLSWMGALESGLGLSASLQYTSMKTAFNESEIIGVTIGANRALFDNTLYGDLSYTLNFTDAGTGDASDTQYLFTLSLRYRISSADALDFRTQFNSYNASSDARTSYAGSTSRLQYTRTFAFGGR